jgi:hypothetical protein
MEIFNRILGYFAEEKNQGYALGGITGGWIYGVHLLTSSPSVWAFLTAEFFLKGVIGIVYAIISGILVKESLELFTEKIKPKIKIFKNGKRKDEEKRA